MAKKKATKRSPSTSAIEAESLPALSQDARELLSSYLDMLAEKIARVLDGEDYSKEEP